MKVDLGNALTMIFKDPRWFHKTWLIMLLSFFPYLLYFIFLFGGFIYMPYAYGEFVDPTIIGRSTNAFIDLSNPMVMIFIIVAIVVYMVVFGLYYSGYSFMISKRVMNGEALPLPELSPFGEKFKYGLINALIGLVVLIVGFVPVVLLMWGGASLMGSSFREFAISNGMMAGLVGTGFFFLIGILFFLYSIFLQYVLVPSMQYLYLKGGVSNMFDWAKLKRVMSLGKGSYIIVLLYTLVIAIASVMFMIVPVLGYLFVLLMSPILQFLMYVMFGQAFAVIEEKI